MKILIITAITFLAINPAWSLCSQASPINCPGYMAVACHENATSKGNTIGNNFASASVFGSDNSQLARQEVNCQELPDTNGGSADPLWCSMHWWICDPFSM